MTFTAQKFPCEMSMRFHVHIYCTGSHKPGVAETSIPRCARFLSYVHSVWQAWHFRDILRSETSFCVTGAGHRTRFHPRGCTLLKHWQAWVKMRGAFGGHFSRQAQYLMNLDDVLKGSNIAFCETVVEFHLGRDDEWWWFRVAGAGLWMPRAHFSWQAQCFVYLIPRKTVAET